MLFIALSHATQTSLALVVIFFVALPALVVALVSFALVQAIGERAERGGERRREL
jgi:hypothetical protein